MPTAAPHFTCSESVKCFEKVANRMNCRSVREIAWRSPRTFRFSVLRFVPDSPPHVQPITAGQTLQVSPQNLSSKWTEFPSMTITCTTVGT